MIIQFLRENPSVEYVRSSDLTAYFGFSGKFNRIFQNDIESIGYRNPDIEVIFRRKYRDTNGRKKIEWRLALKHPQAAEQEQAPGLA